MSNSNNNNNNNNINSNINTNHMSNETTTKNNAAPAEMTAGCCVCNDDQGVEGNPLVYCDGCEVAVHQACYGISRVPAGSWFCSKCESGEPKQNIKCKLCPATDGAFKRTENGHWAHVVCALYIPEIRFGDVITMEPVEICHVRADRWNKTCYICTEKRTGTEDTGAKIDCFDKECRKSFHVTCAQTAGVLFEQMKPGGTIYYAGYCEHHFRKMEAEKGKSANSLPRSSSPSLKSASDPSQDNDSKCNTSSKQDKNNSNLISIQKSSNNNNSNTNHNININNNIKINSPPKSNTVKTTNPLQPTPNLSTASTPQPITLVTTNSPTTTPAAVAATIAALTTSTTTTTTSANITTTTMTPPPQTTASSIDMQEIHRKQTNPTSSNASSIPLTNDQTNSLLNSPIPLGSKTQITASPAYVTQSGTNCSENVHQTTAPASTTRNTSNTDEINTDTQPTVPPIIIPVPKNASNNNTTPPKTTAKSKPSTPRNSKKKTSPVVAAGVAGAAGATSASTGPSATTSNIGQQPILLPQQQRDTKEVKPKTSRAKKNVTINNNNNNSSSNNNVVVPTDNTVATSKPEPTPKRASKPRATPAQKGAASSATATTASNVNSNTNNSVQVDPTSSTPSKRKSRTSSNESSNVAPSPSKKPRKKKTPELNVVNPNQLNNGILAPTAPSVSGTNLLTPSSNLITTGPPNPMVGPSPLLINTPAPNSRYILGVNPLESQDMMNRYYSPMISPYTTNYDLSAAPVLSRSSISRLFASSSSAPTTETNQFNSDDPERLLDELKEQTWSHLSKCILDQAQQFEMPSLIGTLYTLRAENEKLEQRVRELKMKNDQLLSINARLDMPGPLMNQHLSSTSPNFSSVVAGLAQSPKNIPIPSPGSTMNNKQPLISIGPYNHMQPVSIVGAPNFMDRGSPLIAQTHSCLNPNMKTSSISTPSPPIGTLMANRAGLASVNSPYIQAAYNQPPVSNPNPINDYRQMAPKGSGWAR